MVICVKLGLTFVKSRLDIAPHRGQHWNHFIVFRRVRKIAKCD